MSAPLLRQYLDILTEDRVWRINLSDKEKKTFVLQRPLPFPSAEDEALRHAEEWANDRYPDRGPWTASNAIAYPHS